MDEFRDFTDLLSGPYSHADLARALGVNVQHFRQMRLGTDKAGRRPPPADWRERLDPLRRELAKKLDRA